MDSGRATRLYLVRHGEVAAKWRGRVYGDLDVELSDTGRTQAEEAAAILADVAFAAIVSSDLERARFGAASIAAANRSAPPPRVDRRWREISRGRWAGSTFAEIDRATPGAFAQWLADPEHLEPPGGESLAALGRRVAPALEDVCAASPGADVAVVTHGWVLRVVLARILGLAGAAISRLVLPPASIAVVDWPEGATLPAPRTAVGDALAGGEVPHPPLPRLAGLGIDAPPPRS